MEPDEVGDRYRFQANKILGFIKYLENTDEPTKEEYKQMLIAVCQKYYELLMNLAIYTPMLELYKVKFYKINSINSNDSNDQYSDPPFEKDFFNQDRSI